jgi:hypothetical protein
MKTRFWRSLILTSLLGVIAACGGGGGGGFAPTPSSAGGLWLGTLTVDNGVPQQIAGMVSETRQFHFLLDDETQYYGTLTINGNSGTASVTGLAPLDGTFADGSVRGTGTLNVTIQQRSQLTATGTFTTANNTTSNVSMTVQYDHSYDTDSSLAAVDGNYTNSQSPGTDTFSISNGVVTYSDSSGCMANGTVSIIDAQWNLYNLQFTFAANCQATSNLALTGMLTIDVTQNPVLIAMFVHGTVQGAPIAFPFVYQKT